MGILALLAILTGCWAVGWYETAHPLEPMRSVAFRLVLSAIAGWVTLDVLLLALDLAGIVWTRWQVGLAFAAMLALLWWRRPRHTGARPAAGWHLGNAVALAALAVFIVCTALLWNVHSDFIYHWGMKAQRFYLAGGIDVDFLTRPWNAGHLHAEYPNFLPALFALTGIFAGGFELVPVLSWSAVFLAALLLSGHELLRTGGASRYGAVAGMAVLALMLTMFGVGYGQAGGADWLIALALLAGSVALLGPPSPGTDREIGWIAALAAAAKIEGVALAGLLIGAQLLRRLLETRGQRFSGRAVSAALLRTSLPCAAVIGLWLIPVLRDGLGGAGMQGLDLGRTETIARGLWASLLTPNWHGLAFCLASLPLLAADRRLRPAALVAGLQLAFYVAVYFIAAAEPAHYIATSAARLFFHVVPTVLLLAVLWLDRHAEPLTRPHREPGA